LNKISIKFITHIANDLYITVWYTKYNILCTFVNSSNNLSKFYRSCTKIQKFCFTASSNFTLLARQYSVTLPFSSIP
jgi:hypothetical protein